MRRSIRFVAVAALLMTLGFWISQGPGRAQQPSQAGTVPPGIILKAPGESEVQVSLLMADRGQYSATYTQGEVNAGEFVTLTLNQAAYVYLMLINTERQVEAPGAKVAIREVQLLFPNAFSMHNYLQKGDYTFPGPEMLSGSFTVPGPSGTAYMQVVATLSPIGLEPDSFTLEQAFPFLGRDPEGVKYEIERLVLQAGLTPSAWAADWTQYYVVDRLPFTGPEPGKLIVRCLDKQSPAPIRDAQVFVDGERSVLYFCREGTATIEYLSPGEHIIQVEKNGYRQCDGKATVISGQTISVDCLLEPLPRRAILQAASTQVQIGEEVALDACKSTGPILLYEWDFDSNDITDKRTRNCQVATTFSEAGFYTVTLYVIFEDATYDYDRLAINVLSPAGCPPNPCKPGEFYVAPNIIPSNPKAIVGPGSGVTISFRQGDWATFVMANTSWIRYRQLATVLVSRPIARKTPSLSFKYRFPDLPGSLYNNNQRLDIVSLVRLALFDANGNCIGEIEKRSGVDFCTGRKGQDQYVVLDTTQLRSDDWSSLRDKLQKGMQEFRADTVLIHENATSIIITIELQVRNDGSGQDVSVQYQDIELR